MPSPAEIQERLKMSHLGESEDELKDQVKQATRVVRHDDEVEPGEDPRDKEEYPFVFNWTDSRGKVWHGNFVNRILDVQKRQESGVLQATLQGGLPFEAFTPFHRDLNVAIAHMTYSLTKREKWAKDLRKILDPDLILALFEEVALHEATFWRRGEDQSQGREEEQDS
jgi:hypothetical protein